MYLFESEFLISSFKIEFESLWAWVKDNISIMERGMNLLLWWWEFCFESWVVKNTGKREMRGRFGGQVSVCRPTFSVLCHCQLSLLKFIICFLRTLWTPIFGIFIKPWYETNTWGTTGIGDGDNSQITADTGWGWSPEHVVTVIWVFKGWKGSRQHLGCMCCMCICYSRVFSSPLIFFWRNKVDLMSVEWLNWSQPPTQLPAIALVSVSKMNVDVTQPWFGGRPTAPWRIYVCLWYHSLPHRCQQ